MKIDLSPPEQLTFNAFDVVGHHYHPLKKVEAKDEEGHRQRKLPITKWLHQKISAEKALEWHNSGGFVGCIPAYSGLVALDVDEGDPEEVSHQLGGGLICPTRVAGRAHIFFAFPGGHYPNRKWRLGSASGDLRGTNGYIAIWRPEIWYQAVGMKDNLPRIDLEMFG